MINIEWQTWSWEILFVKEYVTIFDDFHRNSTIISKFCLITQKWARREITFLRKLIKKCILSNFRFYYYGFSCLFLIYDFFNVSMSIHSHWTTCENSRIPHSFSKISFFLSLKEAPNFFGIFHLTICKSNSVKNIKSLYE